MLQHETTRQLFIVVIHISFSISMDQLQTGDLLLFASSPHQHSVVGLFDWIIRTATHSPYSHVALVLRDPAFISPSLKGLYIWESSWEGSPDPQDGKTKLGVQITPLHESLRNFQGKVYVRKLEKGREHITDTVLRSVHDVVYDKPYDVHVRDWVGAWLRKDAHPQKTDRFWCSALVAYFMVQFGFIEDTVDWSIIRPADLSSESTYLTWKPTCKYGNDVCIS